MTRGGTRRKSLCYDLHTPNTQGKKRGKAAGELRNASKDVRGGIDKSASESIRKKDGGKGGKALEQDRTKELGVEQ